MEADPNGIDQHQPGAKLDAGKPRVGLLFKDFARALFAVAEVSTYGAKKYTPSGWRTVPDAIERYTDADGRHMLKGFNQELDDESNLKHLAHRAWNALAVLELTLEQEEGKKQ